MANIIDKAVDFLEKIRNEDFVKLKFTKADGTERIMKCTLNFDKIPKSDQPKKIDLPKILKLINNSSVVHVYDLEKKGWRSVKFDRVEWLEDAENVRFNIKRK